ncbi:hypothetical protein ACE1SV_65920 [Streptomyces sennicomposti]
MEALRLGAEGKAAGWRTLRRLSAIGERLDGSRLDTLPERARQRQKRIKVARPPGRGGGTTSVG